MNNQRGRKSAAERETDISSVVSSIERPDPPDDLNDEQAQEWRATVAGLKPDWFGRETHAMLAQYCRHVVAARKISQLIDKTGFDIGAEGLDQLLKMQEREGRAMSSLATRLRITNQATYDAKNKKKDASTSVGKPWQKRT